MHAHNIYGYLITIVGVRGVEGTVKFPLMFYFISLLIFLLHVLLIIREFFFTFFLINSRRLMAVGYERERERNGEIERVNKMCNKEFRGHKVQL